MNTLENPLAGKGGKMTCTGSRNDNENDPIPGRRKCKEKRTKTEEDSVPGGRKTAT